MAATLPRDIVSARFFFNMLKRNEYRDTLKDTIIGDFKWSARSSDYSGWLVCDGRSVSRTTYSDLFAIIGTSFGANDSSTFRLPDCRGRVAGAVGQGSGLTNRAAGAYVGAETHTLTSAEMPGHTHTGTTDSAGNHAHTVTDPGHAHTQTTINDDFNNSGENAPGFTADSAGERTWANINASTTGVSVDAAGAHTHTFTTDSTGGGGAHNNMQPTVFLGNILIYSGVEDPLEPTVDTTGSREPEPGTTV